MHKSGHHCLPLDLEKTYALLHLCPHNQEVHRSKMIFPLKLVPSPLDHALNWAHGIAYLMAFNLLPGPARASFPG